MNDRASLGRRGYRDGHIDLVMAAFHGKFMFFSQPGFFQCTSTIVHAFGQIFGVTISSGVAPAAGGSAPHRDRTARRRRACAAGAPGLRTTLTMGLADCAPHRYACAGAASRRRAALGVPSAGPSPQRSVCGGTVTQTGCQSSARGPTKRQEGRLAAAAADPGSMCITSPTCG